jgi:hypothetical protein
MDNRSKALAIRIVQFLILFGAVLGGVSLLVSGAGSGNLFGVSNRLVFGVAGLVLVVAVAFAGQKVLFSNLPSAYGNDKDTAPDAGSSFALGKYYSLKYSDKPAKKSKADDLGSRFGLKKD